MKAILLAGGFGTRLLPLTYRIPKVMVPVAGKPVMQHLVEVCKAAEVEEIIVSLNQSQKSIEEYFGDGIKFGTRISYAYEDSQRDDDKLGAIGAIQHALSKTGVPKECLIIGGDNVFYGLDLSKLGEFHKKSGAFATMVLYQLADKRDCEQYGVVEVDARGRVLRMQEKPRVEEAVSSLACAAVYQVGEAFLKEYLPRYVEEARKRGEKADRLGDLWSSFVKEIPLYGHAFQGMWGDANSPKTYVDTNRQAMRFLKGSVGEVECRITDGNCCAISPDAQIHRDALVKGPCIIEEDCVVERGAVVGSGTHLMKGSVVQEAAVVSGAIVFEKTSIGPRTKVTECIIDAESKIGAGSVIEPYCLLGYASKTGANARVLSESRVWPFVEVGNYAIVSGDLMVEERLFLDKLRK